MDIVSNELRERIPNPRSREGILTDCISHMRNGVTPMRSQRQVDTLSRLTVRKAEVLSGNGKDQEAKAASRKATGRDNWADRADDGNTRAERRLT
jgi:hypothetical protein